MKSLFVQSDGERRAGLAAVNLFFSVVLGANLGSINTLSIVDYMLLLMLLSGAIIGLFTIAVSKRPMFVWTTFAIYVIILGGMVLFPQLRPDKMQKEIVRIVATLGMWLLLLIIIKLGPVISESSDEAHLSIQDEDEIADLLSDERAAKN